MADDKALDLDVKKGGATEEEAKGSGKLMIIIIVLVVLLAGGGAAAFFLMSKEEAPADADAVAEETKQPAQYLPLKPPFVSNFNDSGHQRYLQIELTLMTRSDDGFELLREHIPKIRNIVLTQLSSQLFQELKTPEGKTQLRETLLSELQTFMEDETGETAVEDVLFSSFVMQ